MAPSFQVYVFSCGRSSDCIVHFWYQGTRLMCFHYYYCTATNNRVSSFHFHVMIMVYIIVYSAAAGQHVDGRVIYIYVLPWDFTAFE